MDLNEIDLGENTERVREVLSLVWAGQLFRAALPLDSDLIVVRDLEIAHEYATTKTCGQDELTWSNVVSERMSKVREYQSGSWPCGWEGHWPHGKLVVFLPA